MIVAYWRTLGDLGLSSVPSFSDPFARQLLAGWKWDLFLRAADASARRPDAKRKSLRARQYLDAIMLRVAFIDALSESARPPQVVILGAGLDTRAYRLGALRGARIFEVDHPATQVYKRKHAARLAPLAELTYVPVDFTRDSLETALTHAGYETDKPTLWIWEGVVMYLDDAALRGTLGAIRRLSAPDSTLLLHYHEPDPQESARGIRAVRQIALKWLGEPQIGLRTPDTIRTELEHAGFTELEDADVCAQASRVGAPVPDGAPPGVRSRIAVATPAAR